jgi:hypothetical protein
MPVRHPKCLTVGRALRPYDYVNGTLFVISYVGLS